VGPVQIKFCLPLIPHGLLLILQL